MIEEVLKITKIASYELALLDDETVNSVLNDLSQELINNTNLIIKENKKDLDLMPKDDPKYDRLLLNEAQIKNVANSIKNIIKLESPLNKILEDKKVNELHIIKKSVPLGVVAIIYEARPNVTLDCFVLCFKSGNATILKGGKEAINSNTILVKIIKNVLKKHNLNENIVSLFSLSRDDTKILLNAVGLIDVCIPRGSKNLIEFVRDNAKIPVIETGAGVVHTYFDKDGDLQKGIKIIDNAKTRRVSVCNALDCLIVHRERIDDLFDLVKNLQNSNVIIYADELSYNVLDGKYKMLEIATENEYGREFLDYKMLIKVIKSTKEATEFIKKYSSQHSEAIITENLKTAEYFVNAIDSACIYINTSTAFTDGEQFGMGAEIGISTQKLHTRGPMALESLTSYKYIIESDGATRK